MLRDLGHEVFTHERHSDDIAKMSLCSKAGVALRVIWSPRDYLEMRDTCRTIHPDVVHIHNTFPLISVAAAVAAHRAGVPVVMTLHNHRLYCPAGTLMRDGVLCFDCVGRRPIPGLVHGCYRGSRISSVPITASIGIHGMLRTWDRHVSIFLTMNRFSRDLAVHSGLSEQKMVIKPHFVEEPRVVRQGVGDRGVYVGRLSAEKGVLWLIEAWRCSLGPLTIIGDGPLRSTVLEISRRKGLDVQLLGRLSREAARAVLAEARYLIMPSLCLETFGLAAVEAMSAGVPVVVPRLGGLPELCDGGRGGVTYDPGSSSSMYAAVARVRDRSTSELIGQQARRIYVEKYSYAAVGDQLERIYRSAR